MTIQLEKPELEVKKTELLQKEEELKVQLSELEESLLEVFYLISSPMLVLVNDTAWILNISDCFI